MVSRGDDTVVLDDILDPCKNDTAMRDVFYAVPEQVTRLYVLYTNLPPGCQYQAVLSDARNLPDLSLIWVARLQDFALINMPRKVRV